jgi:hypothetical protein
VGGDIVGNVSGSEVRVSWQLWLHLTPEHPPDLAVMASKATAHGPQTDLNTNKAFFSTARACRSGGSIPTDPYRGGYTSPEKKWVPYFAPVLGALILGPPVEFKDGIAIKHGYCCPHADIALKKPSIMNGFQDCRVVSVGLEKAHVDHGAQQHREITTGV